LTICATITVNARVKDHPPKYIITHLKISTTHNNQLYEREFEGNSLQVQIGADFPVYS